MVGIVARTLARFPVVVLLVSGCACIALTLIGMLTTDWPDFLNPIQGFNTTGTDISSKLLAVHNLQNEIGYGKMFYQFPDEIPKSQMTNVSVHKPRKEKKKSKKNSTTKAKVGDNRLTERVTCVNGECKSIDKPEIDKEPGYCRINLSHQFGILVFEIDDISSFETFEKMCEIEQMLWMPSSKNIHLITSNQCELHSRGSCCQPWHFGSVAAAVVDKPHCSDVNASDFQIFKELLDSCSVHKNVILDCWQRNGVEDCYNRNVTLNCTSQDFYTFYNFLMPTSFASIDSQKTRLTLTLMMLPMAKQVFEAEHVDAEMIKRLQREMNGISGVRLVAMDLGLRDALFMDYLLADTIYGFLAVILVLVSMWIYTGSLLFTAASVTGVLMSMGVAYFVYRIVFINFFPFMNLLTFVLMIGLGADDTFIYRSAWNRAKSNKNAGTLSKIVSDTLSHAAVSMFVTSLTTAAAFFSNFLSHIIVVKCFGVFAGITVLTNYVVVITWLPAAVILIEKYDCSARSWCSFGACKHNRSNQVVVVNDCRGDGSKPRTTARVQFHPMCLLLCEPLMRSCRNAVDYSKVFFEKLLPWLVIKFRFFWIVLFGTVSVASAVVLFYYPGLRLPTRDYFQYFKSSNPFEVWESRLKYEFVFSAADVSQTPMLTRIIWGVSPTDDASHVDPTDHGSLKVWSDGAFRFDDNAALVWLKDFCSQMAIQNNTEFRGGMLLPYCFVHDFMQWMNIPCTEPDGNSRRPCCNENPFPYRPGVFETCLRRVITRFPNDLQRDVFLTGFRNGPFFSSKSHNFSLLTVAFPSKFNFSLSYQKMDEYYTTMQSWISDRLSKGPWMVRDGWFVSDQLQFYDLQKALLNDTKLSVIVAVAVAFVVLFLTTANLVISALAIASITSVIFTTVACLILMDWELNVLESTIIILTIGLSFDFTLHFGVSYQLTSKDDAENRLIETISRTGGPVFMAMVTTFLAGLAMVPSTTLAYFQIGLFMMIVTLISWSYATLFFCALLNVFGVFVDRCQWSWSSLFRWPNGNRTQIRRISSINRRGTIKVSCRAEQMAESAPMIAINNDDKEFRLSNSSTAANLYRKHSAKEHWRTNMRRASLPVTRTMSATIETSNCIDKEQLKLLKRKHSDSSRFRVSVPCKRI